MAKFKHTAEEAEEVLDSVEQFGQSKWPGMSYEQGVAATLEWLLDGWDDNHPMDDQ